MVLPRWPDCKFIDYAIVNRRLRELIQDASVYRSSVIDVKRNDYLLVVFRVNLKLKFKMSNYLPRSYDIGILKDENLIGNFYGQLNMKLEFKI